MGETHYGWERATQQKLSTPKWINDCRMRCVATIEVLVWAQCCSHLLSELSMKRSSSSQKCSGIPSDSISAKLSPSTWPTQGWVTDIWVSLEHRKLTFSWTNMRPHRPHKRPVNSETNNSDFCYLKTVHLWYLYWSNWMILSFFQI